jgi:putative heme iron utilization protein
MDLQAGAKALRLEFPERVSGPGELRKILVKLADAARAGQ